jgi:hydroxyacyl-ACP dehydratase HTD2-like protein with hotdog domain
MSMDATVEVGTELPIMTRRPDEVDLFMFSAASWLLHRVHYDHPFTTGHDGHEGLLVHGPLQGTYLMQTVERWLGTDARPRSISYRHSAPAFAGETLECGGSVTAVDREASTFQADLWVRKVDGTVTTSGTATFVLPDST